MGLIDFALLLGIAALAGAIGQAISGYSLGGCLMSIVVGFVGAFFGLWIAKQFGLPEFLTITVGGEAFPLVWAIIGSAILSAVAGLFLRRRVVYVSRS